MKPLLFILLSITALALSACAPSNQENIAILSRAGDYVGTLPDGRDVRRYTVGYHGNFHFIYVVKGSVTNNHIEGKTQTTEVTINSR